MQSAHADVLVVSPRQSVSAYTVFGMAPAAPVEKRVGEEEALMGRTEESCSRLDWNSLFAV
jgi:hypothetical protein